jgi:hypothetical protein
VNVFILDADPVLAARAQCDRHVVKMTLETAQLLCAVFDPGAAPYRRTHYNHPCTRWLRTSCDNWEWLVAHGLALAAEYQHRYGRRHASAAVITWCDDNAPHASRFPLQGLTAFAQAMPAQYRDVDAVVAYRAYYRAEKARFAKWSRREVPAWFEEDT